MFNTLNDLEVVNEKLKASYFPCGVIEETRARPTAEIEGQAQEADWLQKKRRKIGAILFEMTPFLNWLIYPGLFLAGIKSDGNNYLHIDRFTPLFSGIPVWHSFKYIHCRLIKSFMCATCYFDILQFA